MSRIKKVAGAAVAVIIVATTAVVAQNGGTEEANTAEIWAEAIAPVPQPETPAVEDADGGKSGRGMGLRLGVGNAYTLGGNIKKDIGDGLWRFDVGIDGGYVLGRDRYNAWAVQVTGFFEGHYNISDDGVVSWFIGPGIALGWYGVSGETTQITGVGTIEVEDNVKVEGNAFNIGLGAQFGLEFSLHLIDPEHSMYRWKNSKISVDVRPMLYLPQVEALHNKFPRFLVTVGISLRTAF
ncbi:MAG: hypothetical protein LBU70_02905 [Chitinispirillales bacterium]|jgi:hypothetical protein|nr:hypothetical protein [Chitinispirillales bacterium]